jgi:hypothetical protein
MQPTIIWNKENFIDFAKKRFIVSNESFDINKDNVTNSEVRDFLLKNFDSNEQRITFLQDLIDNIEIDKKEKAEELRISFINDGIYEHDDNPEKRISDAVELNLTLYKNNINQLQSIINDLNNQLILNKETEHKFFKKFWKKIPKTIRKIIIGLFTGVLTGVFIWYVINLLKKYYGK